MTTWWRRLTCDHPDALGMSATCTACTSAPLSHLLRPEPHEVQRPMAPRPTTTERDKLRKQVARGKPACWICGQPIDYTLPTPHPLSYELDHKAPLNRGGTHTIDNAAASHRACNRAKSDKHHAPIVRRSGTLN